VRLQKQFWANVLPLHFRQVGLCFFCTLKFPSFGKTAVFSCDYGDYRWSWPTSASLVLNLKIYLRIGESIGDHYFVCEPKGPFEAAALSKVPQWLGLTVKWSTLDPLLLGCVLYGACPHKSSFSPSLSWISVTWPFGYPYNSQRKSNIYFHWPVLCWCGQWCSTTRRVYRHPRTTCVPLFPLFVSHIPTIVLLHFPFIVNVNLPSSTLRWPTHSYRHQHYFPYC